MNHKKTHQSPVEFIEDEAKELKRELRRFERFRDENSLLFGILVLGIAALVVINTLFWIYVTTEQYKKHLPQIDVPVYPKVHGSLAMTKNDVMDVVVKNVTTNSNLDPAFTIPSDQTMLIFDMTITNKTDETQQLIPSTQLYVRSREGDFFQLHASMHVKHPIPASEVKPGGSVKGQVSFAIPKKLDTPLFYVDTGWGDSTPLVIDVLH